MKRFTVTQLLLLLLPIGILIIFLGLIVVNRYFIFQKALALFEKVNVTWQGYTHQKIVALTFDDGPDPIYTPAVLTVLEKYHTPATFFVVGKNAQQYPEILKSEFKAGFLIGNHTFNHPHLSQLSAIKIQAEVVGTDRVIKKITGKIAPFFRPPYEELSDDIFKVSRSCHKQVILSTITLEHKRAVTPQAKSERVLRLVFPGAIILAHDGRLDRSATVAALPYLITGLTAKGYRIVPLTELLPPSF